MCIRDRRLPGAILARGPPEDGRGSRDAAQRGVPGPPVEGYQRAADPTTEERRNPLNDNRVTAPKGGPSHRPQP
eukprot:728009-Alexandrium_andersonii.AAC.1